MEWWEKHLLMYSGTSKTFIYTIRISLNIIILNEWLKIALMYLLPFRLLCMKMAV